MPFITQSVINNWVGILCSNWQLWSVGCVGSCCYMS